MAMLPVQYCKSITYILLTSMANLTEVPLCMMGSPCNMWILHLPLELSETWMSLDNLKLLSHMSGISFSPLLFLLSFGTAG